MNSDQERSNEEDIDQEHVLQQLYEKWGNSGQSKLSFFQRFLRSMQSFNFYRAVIIEKPKRSLFYLLKLCALLGLISGLVFGYTSYQLSGEVMDALKNQMPKLTITDGEVSVDAETPYRMELPRDFEAILDPGAELNRIRLEPKVIAVLVRSSLYIRNTPDNFERWPLSTFITTEEGKTTTLTSTTIQQWRSIIQRSVFIMSLIIMLLAVILQTGFWVLIISMGGLIASESQSPIFNWTTFLKLSCYAVTPIALARSVFFITGIQLYLQRYLLLGGGIIFMYFIVKDLEENLMEISFESSNDNPIG